MWEELTVTGFSGTDIGIIVDFLETGQEVVLEYDNEIYEEVFEKVVRQCYNMHQLKTVNVYRSICGCYLKHL